jgi:hypothetical protein
MEALLDTYTTPTECPSLYLTNSRTVETQASAREASSSHATDTTIDERARRHFGNVLSRPHHLCRHVP